MRIPRIRVFFSILVLSAIIFCPAAYSQIDVDRAGREADRPLSEEAEERLWAPMKKAPEIREEEEEIEEMEGQKFFVKEIRLVGCESFSPGEFKSIIEKYENKELSLEKLKVLAKEIEKEYLRKGIIAACFIPPQDIKEGIITLRVVEGKMGKLEIPDHRYFGKSRLSYYWDVQPGEVIHYDKVSRSLQLMNKNPDRKVTATLHAGEEPETTDVLLDVETNFPLHLTASFDNEGITFTGKDRTGIGIRHNNLLGLDDTLLTGYVYGADFNDKYIYHNVPITNLGTSLFYGYSYSKAFPKKEYIPYEISCRAKNISGFIHQDIFMKDEYIGELYLGMDAKDKTTSMYTGTVNRDRLRIVRLGGRYIHKGINNTTLFNPEFSQGINGFGARKKNPLSSRGAESTFSKFNLGIQHKRVIPTDFLDLQTNLKFKGQFATIKLTPQEEFFLGGINSVRGYPAGDFLADDGLQMNAELLIPAFFIPEGMDLSYSGRPSREDVALLLFCDYGYGRKKSPSPTEQEDASMASIGAGVRLVLFNQALLRLEWGFPISDKSRTKHGESRFHLAVDFEDRLPQEIRRLTSPLPEPEPIFLPVRRYEALIRDIEADGEIVTLYKQGVSLYNQGQLDESREIFKQILSLDPKQRVAKHYIEVEISNAKLREKEWQMQLEPAEAEQEKERRAKELMEKEPQLYLHNTYYEALRLYMLSDYNKAFEKFREVQNLEAGYSDVDYYIGLLSAYTRD